MSSRDCNLVEYLKHKKKKFAQILPKKCSRWKSMSIACKPITNQIYGFGTRMQQKMLIQMEHFDLCVSNKQCCRFFI